MQLIFLCISVLQRFETRFIFFIRRCNDVPAPLSNVGHCVLFCPSGNLKQFKSCQWGILSLPHINFNSPWLVMTPMCSAVQCSTVQYSAVQCSAVKYSTMQYSVEFSEVQCSLVQWLHAVCCCLLGWRSIRVWKVDNFILPPQCNEIAKTPWGHLFC